MIDYTLLIALDTVISSGGFLRAAHSLHITQSAVSQRIRSLEERFGAPLIVRSTPPVLTPLGKKLLNHFEMVRTLEDDLLAELELEADRAPRSIVVGVNADSLATWFFDVITPLLENGTIKLEVLVENEHLTHQLLERGEVFGCISSERHPGAGCDAVRLGVMRYIGVCTPKFKSRYFSSSDLVENFSRAPAVFFDRRDWIHSQFFRQELRQVKQFPIHYVPSSQGFVEMISRGLAYGVVPLLQVKEEMKRGSLVQLGPNKELRVPLFLHHVRRENSVQQQFRKSFVSATSKLLQALG